MTRDGSNGLDAAMGLNIDDVLKANDEMSEAIQRVRELHRPDENNWCLECRVKVMENRNAMYELTAYPCPTIQALDGEQ